MTTRGFLLDCGGVLQDDRRQLIPGATVAVEALRQSQRPFRIVTNITLRNRRQLRDELCGAGLTVTMDEILTPAVTARRLCLEHGWRSVLLLVAEDLLEDFAEFEPPVGNERAEAVILGDPGPAADLGRIQSALPHLLEGAPLLSLGRARYWRSEAGLRFDTGPWTAALEFAAGITATVVGKPEASFFRSACVELALPPHEVVMVGDDVVSDVGAAQGAGLQGWLVRTGKFHRGDLNRGIAPERVLRSIAELPGLLDT
jgi:HAD superfamily hydrolase (TIGR01458 family)